MGCTEVTRSKPPATAAESKNSRILAPFKRGEAFKVTQKGAEMPINLLKRRKDIGGRARGKKTAMKLIFCEFFLIANAGR